VPAIRTDEGEVLTENAAILQYIADCFPAAGLAARDGMPRTRLQQWLCFIGTELHKALFAPLLDPKMPQDGKARTLEKGDARLAYLDGCLGGREFLLDRFSVADAYLFTVLNWNIATPVDLKRCGSSSARASPVRSRRSGRSMPRSRRGTKPHDGPLAGSSPFLIGQRGLVGQLRHGDSAKPITANHRRMG
jgi:glutathione S-transferase